MYEIVKSRFGIGRYLWGIFLGATLVVGVVWVHSRSFAQTPSGIEVSVITVTGSDLVPGRADTFYGGTGTSVTFSVTVKNNGRSDIKETLQNQFVFDRHSADDANIPWKYAGSLDKPIYIPLAGIKKGESKTVTLVNTNLSSNTLYIKFRVDETHLIHGQKEPNIESPALYLTLVNKTSSGPSVVETQPTES